MTFEAAVVRDKYFDPSVPMEQLISASSSTLSAHLYQIPPVHNADYRTLPLEPREYFFSNVTHLVSFQEIDKVHC